MAEKRYNRRLYILWAVSILCIALGVVTTSLLTIIPFMLFLLALFFLGIDTAMVLLFALMPFANIFKLTPGSTSLFTVCELVLVALVAVRRRIKVPFFCTVMVMAAYFCVFSVRNIQVLTILKAVIAFFLVYDYCAASTKENVVLTARLLAISMILMLLLPLNGNYFASVVPYLNDLDYLIDTTGHTTNIVRASGFLGDPNYCAAMILMTQALLCVLYYYKSIGNDFWLYTAFLIPLGLFTYSKSYILCVAVMAVLLFLFVLVPKHKVWAAAMLIGMIAVVILIVQGYFPLVQTILQRFAVGNLTSGRTELNEAYLSYIVNNPKCLLLGDGIVADRIAGATNNVHNIYIEILYKLGIVGTVLYLVTLLNAFGVRYIHRKYTRLHMINWLPLLFFLVVFAFLAGVTNYALPFYFCIIYYGLRYHALPSANRFPEALYDSKQ